MVKASKGCRSDMPMLAFSLRTSTLRPPACRRSGLRRPKRRPSQRFRVTRPTDPPASLTPATHRQIRRTVKLASTATYAHSSEGCSASDFARQDPRIFRPHLGGLLVLTMEDQSRVSFEEAEAVSYSRAEVRLV